MPENNLREIYEQAYWEEYHPINNEFGLIYDNARDKLYAATMALGTLIIMHSLRTGSELDKRIIQAYDHNYKLGGEIEDLINSIPQLISEFKRQKALQEHFKDEKQNRIAVKFKKWLGLIPYKIKRVEIDGELGFISPFKNLQSLEDIAAELGRQRAIEDLLAKYKQLYSENGGVLFPESIESNRAILRSSLQNQDLNQFFHTIRSILSTIPYNLHVNEAIIHSNIHLLLRLLDFNINSEVATNIGRIDAVIELDKQIYIFEFKKNDCSVALNQILNNTYYEPFLNHSKKIILVGIAFDPQKRNLIDWKSQEMG